MSKCDLTLVLDRDDRTWAGGERLTGRLRVDVNAGCTCDALTVAFSSWRHYRQY